MSSDALSRAPAVDNDNLALPFRVEGQNANGRVVRLNGVVGEILSAHDYPEAVNILLGEALVLVAMLGTMLKFDGRFILQLHGGGPINTCYRAIIKFRIPVSCFQSRFPVVFPRSIFRANLALR